MRTLHKNAVRDLRERIGSLLDQKLVLPGKIATLQALQPVCSTMLEIAAVERRQANVVLSFKPGQPLTSLEAQLQPLNVQFAQLQMALLQQNRALQPNLRSASPSGVV